MVLPPVPLRRGMRPGTSAHAGYRATTLKETSWRYSHPRIGRYDESLLHRSTAGERRGRKRSSTIATAAAMLLIGSALLERGTICALRQRCAPRCTIRADELVAGAR